MLAAILAGSALASVALARFGDRIGRRRAYRLLLVVMGVAGTVFALTGWLPALLLAGLTGTVSTDVVESGPFTSLEQAMLPRVAGDLLARAPVCDLQHVATLDRLPGSARRRRPDAPARRLVAVAARLPDRGRARRCPRRCGSRPWSRSSRRVVARMRLVRSRPVVRQLAALFALDSFGGGFVPQTFVAYLLARRYDASAETIGLVFFAIGLLQAISFQLAGRLAGRIGLVRTMVFTHLPSNALLAALRSLLTCRGRSASCSRATCSRRWTCRCGRRWSSPSWIQRSAPRPRPTRTPRAT